MKKTFKIAFAFIALLILVFAIGYLSIAFYEMNLNVSGWGKAKRAGLLFGIAIYLCGTPVYLNYMNDNIK